MRTLPRIDLNADVGEEALSGGDGPILDVVTSASVACGVHAGDHRAMVATVAAASVRGVVVGAHPSYDDRDGFGRRPVDVAPVDLMAGLVAQIAALHDAAATSGVAVGFVKPHGALYGRMADDAGTAAVVLDALQEFGDLALLAPAGTRCLALAADRGVRAVPEAFADRAYAADGSLVPRGAPGAVVTGADEVARRALRLATEGVVEAVDGALVDLQPASICVHGDTQGAPGIAAAVRRALEGAGVTVAPFTARPS